MVRPLHGAPGFRQAGIRLGVYGVRGEVVMSKTNMMKIEYSKNANFIMGCPICNFEYNHIESIKTQTSDDYSSDFGDVFRGNATIIYMTCENGHDYRVVFGSHKGWLYLFAVKGTR